MTVIIYYDIVVLYKQTRKIKMILSDKELDKKVERMNLFSTEGNYEIINGLDKAGYYEEFFGA